MTAESDGGAADTRDGDMLCAYWPGDLTGMGRLGGVEGMTDVYTIDGCVCFVVDGEAAGERCAELDNDKCGEEGEEFGDMSQVAQGLGMTWDMVERAEKGEELKYKGSQAAAVSNDGRHSSNSEPETVPCTDTHITLNNKRCSSSKFEMVVIKKIGGAGTERMLCEEESIGR